MKEFTIFDIAKILQLDQEVQDNLQKNFDTYSDSLKYAITKTLWDGLYELHDELTKLQYELFLDEVRQGKRELMNNLNDLAKRSVWEDIEKMLTGEFHETQKIQEIRTKLKSIVDGVGEQNMPIQKPA